MAELSVPMWGVFDVDGLADACRAAGFAADVQVDEQPTGTFMFRSTPTRLPQARAVLARAEKQGVAITVTYSDNGFSTTDAQTCDVSLSGDEASFSLVAPMLVALAAPLDLKMTFGNGEGDLSPVSVDLIDKRIEWLRKEADSQRKSWEGLGVDVRGECVTEHHLSDGLLWSVDMEPDTGLWAGLTYEDQILAQGGVCGGLASPASRGSVRVIDEERVLVYDSRQWKRDNAFLMSAGGVDLSFDAGDAIANAIITDSFLVFTYFDESMLGVRAFDFDGKLRFDYIRDVVEPVDICDVYASCHLDGDRVAFSAYTDFEYVEVDIAERTQTINRTPSGLHGANALSVGESGIWLFANGAMRRWSPGDKKQSAVCKVGKIDLVRGLRGGRFLVPTGHGCKVVTPAA